MQDLDSAKEKLGEHRLVLVKEGAILHYSDGRGVAPLLALVKSGEDFKGASAADRVVGNAAAYLYVLLGVKQVYAAVASRAAADTLAQYGISLEAERLTEGIVNREGTGPCPMEDAVREAVSPADAKEKIERKLAALAE